LVPVYVSVTIRVVAPARLHMGFASTGGLMGRWAGIGLAIKAPATIVEVEWAEGGGVSASGPRSNEALRAAELFLRLASIEAGLHIRVVEAPPRHVGLGAGTQLALSVLEGVSRLVGIEQRPSILLESGLLGGYSWVGVAAFRSGGFILDLGQTHSKNRSYITLKFPEDWFVVHARPRDRVGRHGPLEAESMREVSIGAEVERNFLGLLMKQILPGILDRDLELFGAGLSEYQKMVGDVFSQQQGGRFNPDSAPLVDMMTSLGLIGVGQSSWGPTVYGFTGSQKRAEEAARQLSEAHGYIATVTMANNSGAQTSTCT